MGPSKQILTSIFITAAILVIVGGVTGRVLASKNPSPAPAAVATPSSPPPQTEYMQLLQQANDQLTKANTEITALQDQLNQAQAEKVAAAVPFSQSEISSDQALQLAQAAADPGDQAQNQPGLVDFQGKTAYEVAFSKGPIYVDASTGDILFNGTIPEKITADKAGQIAANYLNLTGILRVDQVTVHSVPLFRVIFSNGTLAWVDQSGQITDVQLPTTKLALIQGGGSSQPSSGSAPASGSTTHDDGPGDPY